jgi:hypothetical protein
MANDLFIVEFNRTSFIEFLQEYEQYTKIQFQFWNNIIIILILIMMRR